VSAAFNAETISSIVSLRGSNITVFISRNIRKPLVTFITPGSPSRAVLPTSYHFTKKTASASPDAFVLTDENNKVPTIITAMRIEKQAFMENPPY